MTTPCPDPGRWVALAENGAPDAEALAAHAESCPDCRRELASALAARGAREEGAPPLSEPVRLRALSALPSRRRGWLPLSAAAALLLLAGIVWRKGPAPSSPPAAGWTGEADRVLGLGRSGTLLLRRGSRWASPSLLSGALVLTARGEPCELAAGPARIRMTEGELALEVAEARAALLLREAWASEGDARIWVRSGSASVRLAGKEETLKAGESAEISSSGLVRKPFPPSWQGGWLPGIPGPRAGGYVWEAVLRRSSPTSSAALRFPAGGRGWELPLGAGLLGPPGEPLRVGIESSRGRVRLNVGGLEILDCPVEALASGVQPSEADAPGIRTWGPSTEIVQERWRAAP